MSDKGKYSSIRVRRSTLDELKSIGRKGETYDDVICWLLAHRPKRRVAKKDEKKIWR
ncbi:hypothetical protein KAT21_03270 [Candidatus Bathyarchaeota archaeon]|nr:hypothetical protein [Candidatus Bathyarchaeota archaeon]